jgi:hypothetical protein
MKSLLAYLLSGAFVGAIVASLLGLWLIPWYNTPGEGMQSVVDSAAFSKHLLRSFVQTQLIGAGVGALVFLIFAVLLRRARTKTPPTASPTPPPAM